MKFNLILLFLILLSINILAQEIILPKNSYSPYETLQARLSLEFLPVKEIQPNQIFLFDSSGKSYFIAPFLTKFDINNYYIYFDLPYNTKEDNYTLRISKILYVLDNVLIEKTITKEFSILNDSYVISISPAIVNLSSTSQDFYIKTFNHGNSTAITVVTSDGITHPYNQPQQIGNSKSFKFATNSKNPEEEVILFYNNKNYTIPVYTPFREQIKFNITNNETNETNITIKENIRPITLITNLTSVTKYLDKTETIQGPLPIKNNLNQSILVNFDINGNIKDIIDINTTYLRLNPNEIKEQYFIVNKNKNALSYEYYGNLTITSRNYSIIFPMTFYVTQQIEEKNENKSNEESHEDLFNESQQEIINPFENKTTKPKTEYKEESNNTPLIILIIILLIILIIILALTRKRHRERTFNEYLKTIERK